MSTVIKKFGAGGAGLVYASNKPLATLQISGVPSGTGNKKSAAAAGATHQSATPSKDEEDGKKEWIPWGANDDFPQQISKLIRKSTVGRAGLQMITKSLYGQRLITYRVKSVTGTGREEIELAPCPEWEEIVARSNFDLVRLALSQDYAYFQINMPQIRFNGNKTKIWAIDFHKMSHCRLSPVDPKTGLIPFVFISGNFPEAKAEDCQKLPAIDCVQYYDQVESIKADVKNFKYVMPQYWPDVLNDYYPVSFWDSARESGWLDISISIPAYKRALFRNQASIKYHIDVPMEWLEFMHPTWGQMTEDQKDTIITELYDELVEQLTGAENAQKALLTFSRAGSSGKPAAAWKITVVDDKMRNDAYLPDAGAANKEILFAMGINPAMGGVGNTGGDHSGGSNNGGSNIRESGLQLRSMLKADRDIIYSVFNFFKIYHGIDPSIQLAVQDQVLTTLDQGKGTEKVLS